MLEIKEFDAFIKESITALAKIIAQEQTNRVKKASKNKFSKRVC